MNQLHTFYEELRQDGVMFCFIGPTSQSVLEGIGQALKRRMEFEQVGQNTIQRVFSIFVEQVQNIINYSTEKTQTGNETNHEPRNGVVVVGRSKGRIYVICGNKASPAQGEKMLERIRHLQRLDKTELNRLYKRKLREEPEENSKGAGLGFIEMFRRASEPPECHVAPLDTDTVFFSIKAIG